MNAKFARTLISKLHIHLFIFKKKIDLKINAIYNSYHQEMSSPIIDGTNIDTSVFAYTTIKPNASGGKVVNLHNKYFKESLTLSTPLILTWGAQEGLDQAKNPTGKFSMSLQFPNADYPNEDCNAFLESLIRLENKIKADALSYSKEWFGKEIKSAEVMDEKFNAMLKYPKMEKGSVECNYSKPPTLTVKIPCWKNVWQPEIYDEDGEPLFLKGKNLPDVTPLDFLKPKTHVICLIQCGGLWFVNGKVSVTWNLKQAIVQKPKTPTIAAGTCFLKPKASDIEKMKTLAPPDNSEDNDGGISTTIVEDSDDEHELEMASAPLAVVVTKEPEPKSEPEVSKDPVPVAVAIEEPKKKKIITKKRID
jgi:hypothetical protein